MDKYYLLSVIDRLKKEIAEHAEKFKNNLAHQNCLPRMEKTLLSLQEELAKLENSESPNNEQNKEPDLLNVKQALGRAHRLTKQYIKTDEDLTSTLINDRRKEAASEADSQSLNQD